MVSRRVVGLTLMGAIGLASIADAQPTTGPGTGGAGPGTAAATPQAAAAIQRQKAVEDAFALTSTANTAGAASELLQIVGQIVVDRATLAGWSILHDKVTRSLDCKDAKTPTKYPRTCKVLDNLRMQDLLASPRVLLDASIADFAEIFRGRLEKEMKASKPLDYAVKTIVGVGGVMVLWSTRSKDGAFDVVLEKVRGEIREAAGNNTCPSTGNDLLDLNSTRAAYAVAMCIVDGKSTLTVKKRLEDCELSQKLLEKCGAVDEGTTAAAVGLRNALAADKAVDGVEGVVSFITNGAAARQRELGTASCFAADDKEKKPNTNLCAAIIEDLGEIGVGLARQDWTRIASGALALIVDDGKLKGEEISGTRFFKLVAAIGQYAMTYKSEDSSVNEGATKARREIIESLVKQMVDRDERTGWVVSVGGSFGVGYMHRKEFDGTTDGSSNFALPIGIGIQSYPQTWPIGFHAQLGVFDLGQYVTFEEDHETTVGTPDAKAAIAISATAGIWLPRLSKSIPIFIGGYGGVAPFVLANGKSEYFVGGIVGAYVPLLDF